MERSTWAWMLAAVALHTWVGPAPCAAQAPNPRTTAPPVGNTEASPEAGQAPSPLLPAPVRAPSSDAASTGPSPLLTTPTMHAPTEPSDLRFPINLATALRLSDAQPIIVAAAQASVWVAEADLNAARVLWVPTLNMGFDYIRHDGGGPDFNKGILTSVSTNFFYAGGGLWGSQMGIIPTTDATFQPLVARQMLNARHWDVQTAKNDALMQTADAYFQVHQHRGMYAGTLYCVERGHNLVERLATMSRDLISEFEVERARNMVADLEQKAVMARQEWRVQSATSRRSCGWILAAVVEPQEHDHVQITLIDPGRSLEDLMAVALTNRPEIASRRALVQAATAAIRREKMRMVLPNVALNGFQTPFEMIQAGIFGFGANGSMNQWAGRDDVSIQPIIQWQNCGFGNLAMIKRSRAQQSQATIDLFRMQDAAAADVTRALARVQSAAFRVVQADRSLRTGIITVNGTFEGLKEVSRFADVLVLISRPQEAVYSLQLLNVAFDEYFTTVAEYNRAQFELFHALGYPANEIALQHPPGEVGPVDTTRPAFLPPVGHGPPPATR